MGIQTQTYKKRVRKDSTLSPQARLVCLVLADLRYEDSRHHKEALSGVSLTDLAGQCGMSRRTLDRYLNEAIRDGWIVVQNVYRDGRQEANRYLLADPSAAPAGGNRLPPENDSRRAKAAGKRVAENGQRLPTVLRSKNSESGSVPPKGSRVLDEQDEQVPVCEPSEPAPVPARDAEPDASTVTPTAAESLAAIRAQRRQYDEQLAAERLAAFRAKQRAEAERKASEPDPGWDQGWEERLNAELARNAARFGAALEPEPHLAAVPA